MAHKYNFDKEKFVYRNLPPWLRQAIRLDWLECLIIPVESEVGRVNDYREDKLQELSYTGQTILLEKVLDDRFDIELRRYLIQHGERDDIFTFFEAEGQAYEIYTEWANEVTDWTSQPHTYFANENAGNTLPANIDFRILAPIGHESLIDTITGTVNKYKIASKRFDTIFV